MRKVDAADIEATMYGPYCQPLVMIESTLAVALRSKVGSMITLDSLAYSSCAAVCIRRRRLR
jgi:hypothetical protein